MASRVCNAAAEGELLVSRITADILGGSPVRLEGPRRVSLKGIGEVELFTACP
jgi:class 3 adenylate cyclase